MVKITSHKPRAFDSCFSYPGVSVNMRQLSPLLVAAQPSAWHPHLCLAKKKAKSFIYRWLPWNIPIISHEIQSLIGYSQIMNIPHHFPLNIPIEIPMFPWNMQFLDGDSHVHHQSMEKIAETRRIGYGFLDSNCNHSRTSHCVYIYNYICKHSIHGAGSEFKSHLALVNIKIAGIYDDICMLIPQKNCI